MLSIESLVLLICLSLVIYIWYESLRIREHMMVVCTRLCREWELQFLDQTVSMTSMRIRRSRGGGFHILRIYQFEVSPDGAQRNQGYVTLLGKTLQSIHIDGLEGIATYYPLDEHGKQ